MEISRFTTFFMLIYFAEGMLITPFILDLFAPRYSYVTRTRKLPQDKHLAELFVLDSIGLCEKFGYSAEQHKVTTDDGYNLILYRITNSPLLNGTFTKKPIVFLQHGLALSSDSWVLQEPPDNLAFLLADSGYDVWIGNLRGNTYCKSHVNLTTDDREFWDFSYHEHGIYDVAKMIDYTLAYTNSTKLYYIGYSMGTTIMYVLLSERPEYNSKIRLGVSLGPIVYWSFDTNVLVKSIVPAVEAIEGPLKERKIYDAVPQSILYATVGRTFCGDKSQSQPNCLSILKFILVTDPETTQLNVSKIPYYTKYYPAGISVKTALHYVQNIKMDTFQHYDYGFVKNLPLYQQVTPPEYDLKKISIPVALIYGSNDIFCSKRSIMRLKRNLQNVVMFKATPFGHSDFIVGMQAKEIVYNPVLELLKKY